MQSLNVRLKEQHHYPPFVDARSRLISIIVLNWEGAEEKLVAFLVAEIHSMLFLLISLDSTSYSGGIDTPVSIVCQ